MGSERLTWEELVEHEPRLDALLAEIRRTSPRWIEREGLDRVWAFTFKPKLSGLVGWDMRYPTESLYSAHAYDIAYHHLYGALMHQMQAAQGAAR